MKLARASMTLFALSLLSFFLMIHFSRLTTFASSSASIHQSIDESCDCESCFICDQLWLLWLQLIQVYSFRREKEKEGKSEGKRKEKNVSSIFESVMQLTWSDQSAVNATFSSQED